MMLLEDMRVVRLVSIRHTGNSYILCDVSSDPNDESWFHMASLHKSAYQRYEIITKDGVLFHPVALGTYMQLDTGSFALNDQPKIQEAIKNYVEKICH